MALMYKATLAETGSLIEMGVLGRRPKLFADFSEPEKGLAFIAIISVGNDRGGAIFRVSKKPSEALMTANQQGRSIEMTDFSDLAVVGRYSTEEVEFQPSIGLAANLAVSHFSPDLN